MSGRQVVKGKNGEEGRAAWFIFGVRTDGWLRAWHGTWGEQAGKEERRVDDTTRFS
jgi:hypothetical protein